MSTEHGGSSSPSVALISPPSDVDYAANISRILHDSRPKLPTVRYDPTADGALPEPGDADLVIVTGSTSRVHDPDPWIDRLASHVQMLVESDTPVLGVCFGHQLLAACLGGTVDTLDTRAAGYSTITTTTGGLNHSLFNGLAGQFVAFLWHRDHVTELPPDATVLARNKTGIQAFACQDRPVFGIQFHPEVGIADARTLTATRPTSALGANVETSLTEDIASRATRARRIYGNALRAANTQDSRV